MSVPGLFRSLVVGFFTLATVLVVPATASAATGTEYVIVNTDGSVTTRFLTTAQAEAVASRDSVRIVSPEQEFSVNVTPTEIVTGFNTPDDAQGGDIIPNRYIVEFSSPVAAVATDSVAPMSSALAPVVAQSWGLDRADQRALPLDGQISRAGEGTGVDVYVIDTGVRASHLDFSSRVVAGFSAVADGHGTDDCHGHGTHVAGTVAGATYGFATKARIVPVRVLDCNGSGSSAGVIAGINWMIQHHVADQPAVANLSLGGEIDIALNDAVERAVADGITVVVAAGNDTTDACTTSPASAASAITVGATTSSDALASYSNVGRCVDILAPGSFIVSTGISSPTSKVMASGTSMAAPHVAGVAAVVLGNSSLSPAQVASRLSADATRGVVTGLPSSTVNALLYQSVDSNVFNGDISDDESLREQQSTEFDSDLNDAELPPPPAPVVGAPPSPDAPVVGAPPSPDAPVVGAPPSPDAPVVGAPPSPDAPVVAAPTSPDAPVVAAPTSPDAPVVAAPSSPDAPVVAAPTSPDAVGTPVLAAPTSSRVAVRSVKRVGKQFRVRVVAPKGAHVTLYRNGRKVTSGQKRTFSIKATSGKRVRFYVVARIDGAIVKSTVQTFSARSRK